LSQEVQVETKCERIVHSKQCHKAAGREIAKKKQFSVTKGSNSCEEIVAREDENEYYKRVRRLLLRHT
jgi:hypothetical protein